MIRAAVLVPAPEYPEPWDWAYGVEARALERGGIAVEPCPWNDVDDLDRYDVILPLVAWGYHLDSKRWNNLLERLESSRAVCVNPVPVLRWNSDKRYLAELAAQGAPVVPTLHVPAMNAAALDEARDHFGPDLVIKPPVSASAYGTHRIGQCEPLPDSALDRAMMVQPFLGSVMEEGEYSLMFFDGEFSHAIVKRAAPGDYRVQPHLGGSERPCEAPPGAREVAAAALVAAPMPPAYARVDLIRLEDGSLAVIELELIEPSLWLQHAPDNGASFAAAIRSRAVEQPLAKRGG